jgi:hypothetical protein
MFAVVLCGYQKLVSYSKVRIQIESSLCTYTLAQIQQ